MFICRIISLRFVLSCVRPSVYSYFRAHDLSGWGGHELLSQVCADSLEALGSFLTQASRLGQNRPFQPSLWA